MAVRESERSGNKCKGVIGREESERVVRWNHELGRENDEREKEAGSSKPDGGMEERSR